MRCNPLSAGMTTTWPASKRSFCEGRRTYRMSGCQITSVVPSPRLMSPLRYLVSIVHGCIQGRRGASWLLKLVVPFVGIGSLGLLAMVTVYTVTRLDSRKVCRSIWIVSMEVLSGHRPHCYWEGVGVVPWGGTMTSDIHST